mmetsp:Transcript_26012/g.80369  ORF Transcript_26012/g.80369 Transcript_26012/m.80369 type:complete len:204 (-) Transcript_26012:1935-2546(-)
MPDKTRHTLRASAGVKDPAHDVDDRLTSLRHSGGGRRLLFRILDGGRGNTRGRRGTVKRRTCSVRTSGITGDGWRGGEVAGRCVRFDRRSGSRCVYLGGREPTTCSDVVLGRRVAFGKLSFWLSGTNRITSSRFAVGTASISRGVQLTRRVDGCFRGQGGAVRRDGRRRWRGRAGRGVGGWSFSWRCGVVGLLRRSDSGVLRR